MLELLHELETTGQISEAVDVSVAGVVDYTSEAPAVERVHGREGELRDVLQSVGRSSLIVVTGMAGMGKTTLGAKVCDELRGQRSLFWRRIRQWDSSASLAERLAAFLEQLGRTALSSYLKTSKAMDLARVEEILLHQLVGLEVLLVFDDVHDAPEDSVSFLSLLFEVLSQAKESSALLLSRTTPGFYSRRAVTMEAKVVEAPLQALDSSSGRAILADAGVPEAQQGELYGLSGGSPLFLKLLARAGTLTESARRWKRSTHTFPRRLSPPWTRRKRPAFKSPPCTKSPSPQQVFSSKNGETWEPSWVYDARAFWRR